MARPPPPMGCLGRPQADQLAALDGWRRRADLGEHQPGMALLAALDAGGGACL